MLRTISSVLVVAALSGTAGAQSSSAQAEALFRQGKQLMTAKKFAEACDAFDASQKLDPSVATLLNQADCREQNGQLATAWGLFLDAERKTRGSTDRAAAGMGNVAKQRAAKLEAKLSKLTIVVAADAKLDGLQITRNNTPADAGTWNHPLPMDGGTYAITARAPDHQEFTTTVTIANAGDTKSVTIPKLRELPKQPVVAQVPEQPATTTPELSDDGPAEPAQARSKVVPIALSVGAAALLGGAVGFELSGRSSYDAAKSEPDDAKQKDLWDTANRKRYVAEGLAVAGVATAAVAVWLFVRSSGEKATETEIETARRGISIRPVIATTGGGVLLEARY